VNEIYPNIVRQVMDEVIVSFPILNQGKMMNMEIRIPFVAAATLALIIPGPTINFTSVYCRPIIRSDGAAPGVRTISFFEFPVFYFFLVPFFQEIKFTAASQQIHRHG